MKKIYFILLMVLGMSMTQRLTAQSYSIAILTADSICGTSGVTTPAVMVWGEFGALPIADLADYNATLFWGDGTSQPLPIISSWSSFTATHSYLASGTYTIHIKLYHLGVEVANKTIEYATYCETFIGGFYLRNDTDCVKDIDEPYVWKAFDVKVTADGTPIDTFTAFGTFYYNLFAPVIGVEYSFEPLGLAAAGYTLACTPDPIKFIIDTLAYPTTPLQFGLDCDASYTDFDLSLAAYAYLRVATGPSYFNWMGYNDACSPTTATVTMQISPKYSFSSAGFTPTSVVGNTVTWTGIPISSAASVTNSVTLNPVGTLTLGDTAHFMLTITPTTGDVDVTNNTIIIIDTIRSSFDPNEKHVSPSGYIEAGEVLTYTINYENLGTDTAFNIYILDELSTYLEPSTFEMIGASHPTYPSIIEKDGVHYLKFDMPNIKLADIAHPESNKGYVVFKMKSKSTMSPGNTIVNTASIYFDYNPAVVTNTVYSSIPEPEGIDNRLLENGITIYPNPSNGNFIVENNLSKYDKLIMINALGQQVMAQSLNEGANKVQINHVPAGVYYITLKGKNVLDLSTKIVLK